MKLKSYIAALHAALLCILLAVSPAGSGSMTLLGVGKAGAGAAYVGPGDVNGAAYAWYGTRGFSAAYSTGSNPALDLQDQAGANPITINILSNGNLDVASINTWVTAHSVTTIKVAKMYDQSGNARHISNATLANMPKLNLSAVSSLPGVEWNGAQDLQTAAGISVAGPFSLSSVYNRTTGSGSLFYDDNNSNQLVANTGVLGLVSNTGFNATAADNTFHAAQALSNGASSSLYIDGVPTTGSVTTTLTANGKLNMGAISLVGAAGLTGFICELGIWASDKSANNSSVNSNQRTYWGF